MLISYLEKKRNLLTFTLFIPYSWVFVYCSVSRYFFSVWQNGFTMKLINPVQGSLTVPGLSLTVPAEGSSKVSMGLSLWRVRKKHFKYNCHLDSAALASSLIQCLVPLEWQWHFERNSLKGSWVWWDVFQWFTASSVPEVLAGSSVQMGFQDISYVAVPTAQTRAQGQSLTATSALHLPLPWKYVESRREKKN